MQQYKLFFLLLTVLSSLGSSSISQPSQIKRTWHWYFGNHAGIDFSSGTAVADTNGALVTSEGCAAISDTSGVLQFYSDGRTVWNRNHQVMPNGTGIMGGANGSSTQQALIIPKPQSPNLYYLFTTDEAENNGANGMRYTVVDMNLDGGNGDVDTTQKNMLLFAPCTEKLAAVNHCNDTNVWVMGHEVNNNHFRAYLVTANGIDTNAVVSAVGFPNMSNAFAAMAGPMKFSPDGKMICQVTDTNARRVELFQFDNYSGIITNTIEVFTNNILTFNLSFSLNSDLLYIGRMGSNQPCHQLNVMLFDSASIINSNIDVATSINRGMRYSQNAADGKQYFIEGSLTTSDSLLGALELPNIFGLGCSYNTNKIYLFTWNFRAGLPNFNESYFRTNNSSVCMTDINIINPDILKIFPNPARDWIVVRGRAIQKIQLINVLGNICIDERVGNSSSVTINTSSLARGIYFLRVIAGNQMVSQKVVLN